MNIKKTIISENEIKSYYSKILARNRQNNEINKILNSNNFNWFISLTFNKNVVDRKNDSVVYKLYKQWISKLRRKYPNMYFLTIPKRCNNKQSNENGCLHYHILIGNITAKQLNLANTGKISCSWIKNNNKTCTPEYYEKTKHLHNLTLTDGLNVYNISDFYWGFSNVTKIQNHETAKFYVNMYKNDELKSMPTSKKNYYSSKNILK